MRSVAIFALLGLLFGKPHQILAHHACIISVAARLLPDIACMQARYVPGTSLNLSKRRQHGVEGVEGTVWPWGMAAPGLAVLSTTGPSAAK